MGGNDQDVEHHRACGGMGPKRRNYCTITAVGREVSKRPNRDAMKDAEKTSEQLLEEVVLLRGRVAALEDADLQPRSRVEEALRQNEARYRALAESTRDIIYVLDRQGTLLYANQAASRCIGIPCDQIPGKRQADLFPAEMAQSHLGKISRVFVTGQVMEEDELFHFGPEEVWLRIHLLPLRDEAGKITSVMGVCHNVTDRKRAEEALQRARDELEQRVEKRTAELRAIFDAMRDGLLIADSTTKRFLRANPAICRMLGYREPEVLSMSVEEHPPSGIGAGHPGVVSRRLGRAH